MTSSDKLDAIDKRGEIFEAAGWKCEVCGESVYRYGTPQLAHRIPKTKANIAFWGADLIHHKRNLAPVCCLRCNSKVLIGGNPAESRKLIAEILADLGGRREVVQALRDG